MNIAYKEAIKAMKIDEVPVGCVIVDGNHQIIAKCHNTKENTQLPTAHAELLCIQKACKKLSTWHLDGCTLYVTLEPCMMCMGTIVQARIKRVVYATNDPKGGCAHSCIQLNAIKGFNHYPLIEYGLYKEECSQLLKDFFKAKRKEKKHEL